MISVHLLFSCFKLGHAEDVFTQHRFPKSLDRIFLKFSVPKLLLFLTRKANHSSRCEIIQHPSDRKLESQSCWFWICKARSNKYWSDTHFYQSEGNSWLSGPWVHENIPAHFQEWCLLIWNFASRNCDGPPSSGVEETCWRESYTTMGKLISCSYCHWIYPEVFIFLLFF